MINANDAAAECFSISINGGKETSERDKMFEVFAETIKILDPSVTEEKIAEVVNYLKAEQERIEENAKRRDRYWITVSLDSSDYEGIWLMLM